MIEMAVATPAGCRAVGQRWRRSRKRGSHLSGSLNSNQSQFFGQTVRHHANHAERFDQRQYRRQTMDTTDWQMKFSGIV